MGNRESEGNQDDHFVKVDVARSGHILRGRRINRNMLTCAISGQ